MSSSSPILSVALNPAVDLSSEAEVVRPTHKIRTVNDRCDPGGGGINVARVVKELGGRAELLFLAGGATGALLDELLEDKGVERTRVEASQPTRISFTVHERQTGLEYRFVPSGAPARADELERCLDAVRARKGGYVVASGSLPNGAPPDIFAAMADIAAANGSRFVLDSSGPGLAVTLEKSRVFLVKPSVGEMQQLVGRRLDEKSVCEGAVALVKRSAAEMVAVTFGVGGALLATAEGVLRLPAHHVSVRSAVGAGDSFVGAMTWALAEGRSREEAFRFGMAAGAATAMTPGTQLCRREDVLRLHGEALPEAPPVAAGPA